jgi:uncharacterized protein (TIGR02145 family)
MNAPAGTLIAYSTAPGTTAQDGSGTNSPYTTAFLESLNIPDLSVTQLFQNVTKLVSQRTGKQQIPWISSSLTGDFYLNINQPAMTENVEQNIPMQPSSLVLSESVNTYTFLDPIENLLYKTVKIGNQVWMAENLKATKYNDGFSIPLITGQSDWSERSTPGYCWYENDRESYGSVYGALYNWYAVNTGKICPVGWHVPNDDEWKQLEIYLGVDISKAKKKKFYQIYFDSAVKLKEKGTTHWKSHNEGATNETGFTALPGGSRNYIGVFHSYGESGTWWSSTSKTETYKYYLWSTPQEIVSSSYWNIFYLTRYLDQGFNNPRSGFSVRCIKD